MLSKLKKPEFKMPQGLAKRAAMVGGTFAVALGIGFFMQQGDASAARMSQAAPGASPNASEPVLAAAKAGAPAALQTGGLLGLSVSEVSLIAAAAEQSAEQPQDLLASGGSCTPVLTATPAAAAMVSLVLNSACNPNERVTVHHEGMMFTMVTDLAGRAEVMAPALSEEAVFIAAMADGGGVLAKADVPSLVFYDRVVLQWQGETGLQVHALEFGASYGDAGHVWSEASREMEVAAKGEGGFVARLGDVDTQSPRLAEVYTFPTGMVRREGRVELSVEAEVSAVNCNRGIAAQTLQVRPDQPVRIGDLTLDIPDCDAIGEFLVLKNLFEDLKLASG